MSERERLTDLLGKHHEGAHVYSFPDGTRGRRCTCKRVKYDDAHLADVILREVASWLHGGVA